MLQTLVPWCRDSRCSPGPPGGPPRARGGGEVEVLRVFARTGGRSVLCGSANQLLMPHAVASGHRDVDVCIAGDAQGLSRAADAANPWLRPPGWWTSRSEPGRGGLGGLPPPGFGGPQPSFGRASLPSTRASALPSSTDVAARPRRATLGSGTSREIARHRHCKVVRCNRSSRHKRCEIVRCNKVWRPRRLPDRSLQPGLEAQALQDRAAQLGLRSSRNKCASTLLLGHPPGPRPVPRMDSPGSHKDGNPKAGKDVLRVPSGPPKPPSYGVRPEAAAQGIRPPPGLESKHYPAPRAAPEHAQVDDFSLFSFVRAMG